MISAQQQKRIEKLNEDEFYLIGFDGQKEILMTGSKKDVYTVNLAEDGHLSCNCPDSTSWAKKFGIVCKHICFIYMKICKSEDMTFFERQKLTTVDIEKLKMRTKVLVKSDVAQVFYKSYLTLAANKDADQFSKAKREGAMDDACCPICFDDLVENIKFCPQCSNPVHDKCIEKWLEKNTTCVYCRSDVWKNYNHDSTSKSKYVKIQ
jgi:hypothetical protein